MKYLNTYVLTDPDDEDLRLATQIKRRWRDSEGAMRVECVLTDEHYQHIISRHFGVPATILPPHGE